MTPRPTYTLDHICLAVRKLEPARAMLERLFGYVPGTDPVVNTRQQAIVQFMRKPGSIDIKLIEPSSTTSPLVDFIKRRGGGLHHLAFRTESVERGVGDLEALGARTIVPPAPGEAFDEALIAFLFAGSGLNVELIDTVARRSSLPPPEISKPEP